jgi:glycyl-tRNA synthetase beta subunit
MKLVKPADLPEEEERTLHPEGTYNAVVTNCIAKKSRQGNDMLEFTLKTDQGKLRYWLTYIPTKRFMIERFHQVLTAVGVKPDVVDAVDDWDELALATVKAKVLIAVTHEDRDGKTFDSVTAIDELGTEPF